MSQQPPPGHTSRSRVNRPTAVTRKVPVGHSTHTRRHRSVRSTTGYATVLSGDYAGRQTYMALQSDHDLRWLAA
jgi:hypothetical protein